MYVFPKVDSLGGGFFLVSLRRSHGAGGLSPFGSPESYCGIRSASPSSNVTPKFLGTYTELRVVRRSVCGNSLVCFLTALDHQQPALARSAFENDFFCRRKLADILSLLARLASLPEDAVREESERELSDAPAARVWPKPAP